MVKPPVQVFGLEGRYACALYSAASKQKSLEAVEKDLTALQKSMKADVHFRDTLINPTIKRSAKAVALKDSAKSVGWAPATGNLLEVLAENGRLNKLNTIIDHYKLIMSAHRGEVVCEVVTAKALDNAQRKDLENALKVRATTSSYYSFRLLSYHSLFVFCRNS
jgi:F-type H+-transporting ATPase subunit O